MSLLSGSVRAKRILAPPISPPLTIVHVADDSVEVNVASDSRSDGKLFEKIRAKEKELIYQKLILEGCQNELLSLKAQIQVEVDPHQKRALLVTAQKFASAFEGKKEQFVASYQGWKNSLNQPEMPRTDERRE